MKQVENTFVWFLFMLLVLGIGCSSVSESETAVMSQSETLPQPEATVAEAEPKRIAPSIATPSEPDPTALPTIAVEPIEPCRLPVAAFTNVGLGVPRPSGFTPSLGTVKAAVLFVDFADAPAVETPEATFARVAPGSADFFQQISYGRMMLNLAPHLQWLRLSQPSTHYAELLRSADGHLAFIQEAVDLADAAVDFSDANLVIVLANPAAMAIPYGPAFGASSGFPSIEADGVSIPSGVTSGADLNHWGYLWLNHEMGHNMTLPDLYAYETSGSVNGGLRFTGIFSLMGDIAGRAPEFFAIERWQLGWLDDTQIVCQTDGERIITLSAIEQAGGTKAVVVPTGATSAIVVESRRAIGYDTAMTKEGALVYTVDTAIPSGAGPIQVESAHENDLLYDQAPLAVGESLTVCHVVITVVEANEAGDTVQVTAGAQNPCATAVADTASDPCADVPLPIEAEVMLRFVNRSGADVVVLWEESPNQLLEYFRVADGVSFDQETFAGHTWVMQDLSGNTLQRYTATVEVQQCFFVMK